MPWILLTVVAISFRSTFSIATKVLTNYLPVSSGTQSALVMGAAAGITLLMSPFIGGISFAGGHNTWIIALAMIVTTSLGNILFFKGMRHLDAGSAQIAFSSILVWGAILSVLLLASTFSFIQILGILLLLAAIITVQYQRGKRRIDIGIVFMVGAAAMFAGFQVTSAQLAKTMTPATYLLLAYAGATIFISIAYAKTFRADWNKLKQQLPITVKAVTFAAITSLLYYLFSYYAYRSAPDRGVVVLLLTTQVVLSVILGIIFLKERHNVPRKLFAACLALFASFLIK